MSSYQPSQSENSFVPPNVVLPDNWEEARTIIEDRIVSDAHATNAREIGQYVDAEIVTGQEWFTDGDATKTRQTFRKVVDFGALPNNATKSVAHGLDVTGGTLFTKIYGCASDPGTKYLPLPYVEIAGGSNIQLDVDATNVNIVTNTDYTAYTTTYVVLEYIKE